MFIHVFVFPGCSCTSLSESQSPTSAIPLPSLPTTHLPTQLISSPVCHEHRQLLFAKKSFLCDVARPSFLLPACCGSLWLLANHFGIVCLSLVNAFFEHDAPTKLQKTGIRETQEYDTNPWILI